MYRAIMCFWLKLLATADEQTGLEECLGSPLVRVEKYSLTALVFQ